MVAWAMVEAKWLIPPPLMAKPEFVKRAVSAAFACTQPARSPGDSILEKDPIDTTRPRGVRSNATRGGGGGAPACRSWYTSSANTTNPCSSAS